MVKDGEFYEDNTISNDEWLLRRIDPNNHLTQGKLDKSKQRLSSGAFNDSSDGSGMSTHLQSEVVKNGAPPESVLDDYPGYYLVRFKASEAINLGMKFFRRKGDALDHIFVEGKKKGKVRNSFRDNCEWLVKPPDLEE